MAGRDDRTWVDPLRPRGGRIDVRAVPGVDEAEQLRVGPAGGVDRDDHPVAMDIEAFDLVSVNSFAPTGRLVW